MARFQMREEHCIVIMSGYGTEDKTGRKRKKRTCRIAQITGGLSWVEGDRILFRFKL